MLLRLISILVAALSIGCNFEPTQAPANLHVAQSADRDSNKPESENCKQISQDDLDLFVSVITKFDDVRDEFEEPLGMMSSGYLTFTPSREWTKRGGWKDFPKSFHELIESPFRNYRPASEAVLLKGEIFPASGHDEGPRRMVVLEIEEWFSPNEAVVTETHYHFSGTFSFRCLYEKIDGKWSFKKSMGGSTGCKFGG